MGLPGLFVCVSLTCGFYLNICVVLLAVDYISLSHE